MTTTATAANLNNAEMNVYQFQAAIFAALGAGFGGKNAAALAAALRNPEALGRLYRRVNLFGRRHGENMATTIAKYLYA